MASMPNPEDDVSQLRGSFPSKSQRHPGDSTQRLSERAVKAARAFSYNKTVSYIVPCSVFDDDHYIRRRRHNIGIAGALASALPQGMVISLDIIKSNMQANAHKYPNVSSTLRSLLATGGGGVLQRGLTPTLLGYSVHGFVKFRTFDWLRESFRKRLGSKTAKAHEDAINGVSIAIAEFVAVIPLSPLAMVKLKMETSAADSRSTKFVTALRKMSANRVKTGFPFRPLVALWFRQIPLSVTQLYLFDSFRSKVSAYASAEQRHDWAFGISIVSGLAVGVISTPLSQPADYVLSRFTVASNRGKSGIRILAEDGLRTALTRGLAPRYVMVGMMTALQLSIYDGSLQVMQHHRRVYPASYKYDEFD